VSLSEIGPDEFELCISER